MAKHGIQYHSIDTLRDSYSPRLAAVSRVAIEFAYYCGWTVRSDARGGSYELRSPTQSSVAIIIPGTQASIKDAVGTAWLRKVARYSTREDITNFLTAAYPLEAAEYFATNLSPGPLLTSRRMVAASQHLWIIAPAKVTRSPLGLTGQQQAEAKRLRDARAELAARETPPTRPEITPTPRVTRTMGLTEAERPWTAHKVSHALGGTGYQSHAVIERYSTTTGQVIDYRCPECDYVSDRPRSVSAHFGAQHRRGKGRTDPQEPTVFMPEYTEPAFHRDITAAVTRLQREIEVALAGGRLEDLTPQELATRIVSARVESGTDAEPKELTPEQVLARIALLVDRGMTPQMGRRIEELEASILATGDQLAQALAEAAEQRHRAEGIEGELGALADMLARFRKEADHETT